MPPGDLDRALCGLKIPTNPDVIVGLERADDAGVYRVTPDLAIIQTVDFFTPMVDDPYRFGQIAAANALSDIYAMGGVPKTAMNLVGFPVNTMDMDVLRQVLAGGLDKMVEAEVALVGGHSVADTELKYGLSVTGFIHPDRVLTKGGMKPGDRLILTKPLGTGIITTAIKGGIADGRMIEFVSDLMAQLNRRAAEVMAGFPVHACTDITGFGLLGHLAEMVADSGLGVRIEAGRLPVIPGAIALADMGMIPAGAYHNRDYRASMIDIDTGVDRAMADLLFDPQTSGGLLIAVSGEAAAALSEALLENGVAAGAIIGEATAANPNRIVVAP